uniref:Uncharacterized protein n=1 Tax=Rhizophora mucronata TaxID=61149 RepID=A0A2P2KGV5_RHIMU
MKRMLNCYFSRYNSIAIVIFSLKNNS